MKIGIIVSTYLETSKPYLDLCIASVKNLNTENLIVDSYLVSPKWYKPEYEGIHNIHPEKDDYYPGHALNVGASFARDCDYYFFVNDDCLLTKDCLKNLITSAQFLENSALVMSFGNDQQQGKFILPVPYMNPGPYRVEQIEEHANTLMNASSYYPQGLLFFNELGLFNALLPRAAYEAIGPFYDSNWHDDTDYCRRLRANGYLCAVDLSSLAYHAMGATSSKTLGTLSSEERARNLERFNQKWGDSV